MSAHKVVKLDIDKRSARPEAVLDHIHGLAGEFLGRLLRHMLDNADDTLFSLADKAQSDQRQNAYFDAMRALRITRGDIESGFRRKHRHYVESFIEEHDARTGPDDGSSSGIPSLSDDLSLVDEGELEASLALTGMIDKAHSRLARELFAIERRYQALLDRPRLGIDEIPIGPRMICHSFDDPMQSLNLEIEIRLIVYKLFDRDVMGRLGPLYDRINDYLVGAGILPVLRMATPRTDAPDDGIEGPPPPLPDPAPDAAAHDAGTTGSSEMVGAFATLRSLLQGAMDTGNVTPAPSASVVTDNTALLDIVGGLQRLDMASSTTILREKVDALQAEGRIRQVDRDIICIVEMLFDYILEDPAVPAGVRAQIGRLQIPVIRLALNDDSLFEERQHPARKLINRMAHASAGLEEGDEETQALIQRIERIVEQICNQFDGRNSGLFENLLADFEDFLAKQARPDDEAHRRIEERERRARAEARVERTIAELIDGHCLPRPVFDIIDGPWKRVMLQACLESGEDGEDWQAALELVERLIESVEPGADGFDGQRLVRRIPGIVTSLRAGLERIDHPENETETLLAELETVHLAALRGQAEQRIDGVRIQRADKGTEPEFDIDDLLDDLGLSNDAEEDADHGIQDTTEFMKRLFGGEIEEIVLASNETAPTPEIDDEAWSTVTHLENGQWLSLPTDDGRQQRAKLVWKSDLTGECTFANWRGRITAEMHFNELAALIRNGDASIIEGRPVFERAVEAVMNSLRSTNGKA